MTITYNHLNLPTMFTWTSGSFNGNTVEILYDAAGTKLKKIVKTGATVNYTQEYIGGIEYRDTVREAIYTAEGRVFNNAGTNRYEYTIKDHLGNARISFTDKDGDGVIEVFNSIANEVLQENHYYPFGLNYDGPWMNDAARDNKYQYNGKELNDDFSLNLNDYGARWYDAAVGRWWSLDPLADKYSSWSPYNYGINNPAKMIDPDGKAADWFPEYDKKTGKVNLVAEAGDNKATLAKWGNGALSETEVSNLYGSLKDGKIDMSGTAVGDVAKGFEAEAAGCEFNCFSTVESGLSGDDKSTGYGPSDQDQFKEFVSESGLKESPANDKTLGEAQPFNSAFGYTKKGEPGVIDHVSINAGKDSKGNTWVLTKDGNDGKLQFQQGNDYYKQKPDKVYQEKKQK